MCGIRPIERGFNIKGTEAVSSPHLASPDHSALGESKLSEQLKAVELESAR